MQLVHAKMLIIRQSNSDLMRKIIVLVFGIYIITNNAILQQIYYFFICCKMVNSDLSYSFLACFFVLLITSAGLPR